MYTYTIYPCNHQADIGLVLIVCNEVEMITQNLSHLPRSFDISRKKLLLANMSTTSPTNIVSHDL
uniref:Uncharacterized protein n=1 Tax=Anguilla anguilla TaxID=7936 RepID=A0A0E9SXJ0_ANGAN